MAERLPHFHRGRVLARVAMDTEAELSSLPMVLITPTVAAVVATAVAVSEPLARVHDGVVDPLSLWEALRYAVEGAFGGIVVVIGLVAVARWLVFRCGGDPIWELAWGGTHVDEERMMFFELRSKSPYPVDPSWLGAVECQVRTPSGATWSHSQVHPRVNPPGFIARFELDGEPGDYAYRWYAVPDGRRLYEVGRARYTFRPEDPPTVPPPLILPR